MKHTKQFPDNFFDLAFTDPPYGLGVSNCKRGNKQHGKSLAVSKDYGSDKWDNKPMTPAQQKEIIRISKNQIIFGGNFFKLPLSSGWIVWDKDNGGNGYADCELIWTSFDKAIRKIKYTWHGMRQENMKNKEVRYHPTQKPVPLCVDLLEKLSKPGDFIIDPFAGSGSLLVACAKMDRNFLGFELYKKYCEITSKRIKAARKNISVKELENGQDAFNFKG